MAILILIHHLYQHSGLLRGTLVGYGLQALGYWVVGSFFFLSGYGLLKSYKAKGTEYIDQFPRHRILPFYLLMVVLIGLYSVENLVLGGSFNLGTMIYSLTFGGTIIGNGWYLQVQLLIYILFYLTVCLFRERGLILATALEIITYMLIAFVTGMSFTWYVTVPSFVIGLMWASWKGKIDSLLLSKGKWILCVGVSFAGCIGCYGGYYIMDYLALKAIFLCLSSMMFSVMIILIVYFVPIKCSFTRLLGSISLEIYVTQGLFLKLFHSDRINVTNPYLFILAVIGGTLIFSILLHPLTSRIFSICKGNSKINSIKI